VAAQAVVAAPGQAPGPAAPAASEAKPTEAKPIETGTAGAGAAAEKFSEAETRLWMTDHLRGIAHPQTLHYEFHKSGSQEEGFSDHVDLFLTAVHPDGSKAGRVNFFTGERHMEVPEYESLTGNPLLAVYLQGDMHEMNRLTGGNWRYFHRGLKIGFQSLAAIRAVQVDWQGKKVPATEIFVRPYVNDPKRKQIAAFADKSYSFILADDVPGMLYEITTEVPADPKAPGKKTAQGGANADAKADPKADAKGDGTKDDGKGSGKAGGPLLRETLRLVGVEDGVAPAAAAAPAPAKPSAPTTAATAAAATAATAAAQPAADHTPASGGAPPAVAPAPASPVAVGAPSTIATTAAPPSSAKPAAAPANPISGSAVP
jgi:hypothetical protein